MGRSQPLNRVLKRQPILRPFRFLSQALIQMAPHMNHLRTARERQRGKAKRAKRREQPRFRILVSPFSLTGRCVKVYVLILSEWESAALSSYPGGSASTPGSSKSSDGSWQKLAGSTSSSSKLDQNAASTSRLESAPSEACTEDLYPSENGEDQAGPLYDDPVLRPYRADQHIRRPQASPPNEQERMHAPPVPDFPEYGTRNEASFVLVDGLDEPLDHRGQWVTIDLFINTEYRLPVDEVE
jgi:hypothetical protein